MQIRLLVVFLLAFSCKGFSQNLLVGKSYPQGYFRQPLDLPPSLAGCFGEIRAGHFHSGLDYRTNQREGYPVYAAADGYVSRLRVQIGGGGNHVYLTHPNGYSTVYMHLQRFNPRIAQTIKNYQYRLQSYDVDFQLLSIEIPVKKGEIIAWSGNTGSTGGPHLHFEIRDAKTEETLNPQLFGVEVPDKVKPVINGMYMYRLNGLPFSEKTPKQYFQVAGSGGNYHLNQSPVIQIGGEVGFGIMTYDQQFVGSNQNGVYSIELKQDGQTIFASALEGFFFWDSRAVNSQLDYPALMSSGRRIQKSFIEPGNPLTIYKTAVNRGILKLADNQVHNMQYIVKDAKGNTSTLDFKVKGNAASVLAAATEAAGVKKFYYNQLNEFSTNDMKIEIPKGVLYSDIDFMYSSTAKPANAYSKVHHIHNRLIPAHSDFTLWIKPDSTLTPNLYAKALIADTRGISFGGEYENGYIKASSRTFGNYFVKVDTIAPQIRPINIADGKSMAGISKMSFKISDNLSGIKTFSGTIDGQWVLMEFDLKTATLWHTFDEQTKPGKHLFQLMVSDMKSNTKTYTATFYR